MIYECDKCDYTTKFKSNLHRHFQRKTDCSDKNTVSDETPERAVTSTVYNETIEEEPVSVNKCNCKGSFVKRTIQFALVIISAGVLLVPKPSKRE